MLVHSEAELIRRWKGVDASSPLVSVVCCTFNHARYIDSALKSFFAQITNFTFEVVVQNDASTDDTEIIIAEWEKKFPTLLRVFNHKENKFKQGIKPGLLAISRARGIYVAMCDGDDCWLDPHKLQKQYDALLRHPNIDLCFHPANEHRNGKFHSVINDYYCEEKIIPFERVVEGRGGYIPTASIFIRRSSIMPFPDWLIEQAPVGDVFIQALGATKGGAIFLPDRMSTYNRFTVGSATARNLRRSSLEQIATQADRYGACYSQLAEGLSKKQRISCRAALSQFLFDLSVKALDAGYVELFKSLFDRAWPDMKDKNIFARLVWGARYVHFFRSIVRKKLAHKRSLVVT
jgi:glycosyltransferase involved in cell wall biosynthesis